MISSVTYGQTILHSKSGLVKSFSPLKFTANQSDIVEMGLIMFLASISVVETQRELQEGVISIALWQTWMRPELIFIKMVHINMSVLTNNRSQKSFCLWTCFYVVFLFLLTASWIQRDIKMSRTIQRQRVFGMGCRDQEIRIQGAEMVTAGS